MNYNNINYIRSKEAESNDYVDNIRNEKRNNETIEEVNVSRSGIISSAVIISVVLNIGVLLAIILLVNK